MKKYDQKEVGKALQRARKDAGFKSAKEFANHMGMNPGTYTNYEQGYRPLSCETAWDIADELMVSLDELAGREWPPGDSPALSTDERGLVDSYRRMDDEDKPGFMTTARGLAYAGEAKKEGKGADAPVAERAVTEDRK